MSHYPPPAAPHTQISLRGEIAGRRVYREIEIEVVNANATFDNTLGIIRRRGLLQDNSDDPSTYYKPEITLRFQSGTIPGVINVQDRLTMMSTIVLYEVSGCPAGQDPCPWGPTAFLPTFSTSSRPRRLLQEYKSFLDLTWAVTGGTLDIDKPGVLASSKNGTNLVINRGQLEVGEAYTFRLTVVNTKSGLSCKLSLRLLPCCS